MRRIWNGEPPFEGADPVGPAPVQGGLDARDRRGHGPEGDRPRRRTGPTASTARGRWTATATPWPPRSSRSAARGRTPAAPRRRTCRPASGTRSATARRTRLRDYAYTYMKIIGDEVGDWAARFGHLLHARRAERRGRARARCRRRRVLPRADDVRSRRARAHAWMPSASDGCRRAAGGGVGCGRPRRLRRPVVPRRSRRALGVGHQGSRPQRDRHDGARSAGADVPGQPAAGPRVAPHPSGLGHHSGGGTADPGRHAPQRHHRVQPPARGRSRQPLAARLGGQRVGTAAEQLDLPRRPALRRGPRPRPALSI